MIYLQLFIMFFRIGIFNFGGGIAMLPLIFQSVRRFGIMSPHEFSDLVAISQVTPGPVAVNAATFTGFNAAGLPGAAMATAGVCVPSFALMIVVLKFMGRYKEDRYIKGALYGIRPVTVGLVASASFILCEGVLVSGELISKELLEKGMGYLEPIPAVMCIFTILLMWVFKIKPLKVMLLMGIGGAFLCG